MKLGLSLGRNHKGLTDIVINPVVEAFVTANSIVNSNEINALNSLYNGLNSVITAHGVGSILYMNGISPTSLAASKEAIIFGTGSQTATAVGVAATHSADGVEFNGTGNYWKLGALTNNKPQNEILTGFQRTNTITVLGISMGFRVVTEDSSIYPRLTASGAQSVGALYTANDFTGAGTYIGYQNGTTKALWVDGIFQTPDTPLAPLADLTGTNDYFFGARNLNGLAFNWTDERFSCVVHLWDGGTMFTNAQVQTINSLITAYNTNN